MPWERYLQLTVNLSSRSGSPLVRSATDRTTVEAVEFFARDTFPLRLRFVEETGNSASPLSIVQLPAGFAIALTGNTRADIDADPSLYSATDWAEVAVSGSDWYYHTELDLNTTPGNAAVDALSAGQSLDCLFDIEIQNAANTQRNTKQFRAYIKPDAARGQGSPTPGEPTYPIPANLWTKAVVPATATDFTMFPGSVAPATGVHAAADDNYHYTIIAGETSWRRTPRTVWA